MRNICNTEQNIKSIQNIELKKYCLKNSNLNLTLSQTESINSFLPTDNNNLVYIIFVINGIGTLMPWNMFITAKSYYIDYKLNVNLSDINEQITLNQYRENFLPITGLSSQLPNLFFSAINIFLAYKISSVKFSLTKLITGTIIINLLFLIFTIVIIWINTSLWTLEFFYLTIISVILLNMSNGLYQNSIYGLAAKLPMKFTNAIIFGNNICGTIVSLVSIISIAISPDYKISACFYFTFALFILIFCLFSLCNLTENKFYKYHTTIIDKSKEKEFKNNDKISILYIFKKCGAQFFNIYTTFLVTLTLFPSIISEIEMSNLYFFETKKYFTPVYCYLFFNLFSMLGSFLPNFFIIFSPKYLYLPVILRFLFIPFFLFCNFKNIVYALYITNDVVYIIGVILFGLSHGYLSSLGMMFSSNCVKFEYSSLAGMFSAFFLVSGIFSGVLLSFIF